MDLLFPFYTIIDVWDDWPESSITDISNAKFASMESGGFKVLKKENVDLGGIMFPNSIIQILQEIMIINGIMSE